MSTADEVRSILREAGVPLTSRQIIDMLSDGCSNQSVYVFLSDAKKRGELETVMEDGKAAYRFAAGAPARVAKAPAKKSVPRESKPATCGARDSGNPCHIVSIREIPNLDCSFPSERNAKIFGWHAHMGYRCARCGNQLGPFQVARVCEQELWGCCACGIGVFCGGQGQPTIDAAADMFVSIVGVYRVHA